VPSPSCSAESFRPFIQINEPEAQQVPIEMIAELLPGKAFMNLRAAGGVASQVSSGEPAGAIWRAVLLGGGR
jgi:hypothetical protein